MTTKIALDAATDQCLAVAREERHREDRLVQLLDELAGAWSDMLATQFPGDEELAGRVLASVSAMLAGVIENGLPGGHSAVVLAFTAAALHRKGAQR